MRFMFLCYDNEKAWSEVGEAEHKAAMQVAVKLTHELDAKGQYIMASPLHSVSTATCVRIRDGKRIVTDGPFAETREQLGGFYVIDAKDRDEAVAIAKKHPGLRFDGGVEVRPLIELPGMP
jgi:hypothetical protein